MKTKNSVNVAVVGLGFMGVTHLRAYLENPAARVVAVCGTSRLPVDGVLKGVAGNLKHSDDIHLGPDVKVFQDLDQLLSLQEVQLVDLCTPTRIHAEQAIASLRAGKHVLCEKPLARQSTEARRIVKAADDSPGFLMPAMCIRFWPGWSWLKQIVAEGTYGQVLAARFRRVSEMPNWGKTYDDKDGGGALLDLHIHDTDFVNSLFGRPASVFSSGVLDRQGVINHVITQYNYPAGTAVQAEGSWLLTQGFNMAYTLYCERATIDFDFAREADAMQITESGQPLRIIPLDQTDGYGAEISYFLNCILNDETPCVVTGQDAVTALEICEAEEQSVRTGRAVNL